MCPDGLVTPYRDIWSLGIPLRDAAYEFAPDKLRAVLDASQVPWLLPYLGDLALGFLKNTEAELDPKYAEWTRDLKDLKKRVRVQADAYQAMTDQLLSDIQEGRYLAYGYERPRKLDNHRVKIPADLFERKYIDWENSSIKSPDLEFTSVLVFESGLAREIDAELSRERSANANHRKRGPESSNSIIATIIQSLIDDGSLRKYHLQKKQFDVVRKHAIELYSEQFPNGRGLSDESIRKVLVKLIPRARN